MLESSQCLSAWKATGRTEGSRAVRPGVTCEGAKRRNHRPAVSPLLRLKSSYKVVERVNSESNGALQNRTTAPGKASSQAGCKDRPRRGSLAINLTAQAAAGLACLC